MQASLHIQRKYSKKPKDRIPLPLLNPIENLVADLVANLCVQFAH